jgi:hypothetical protein
MGQRFDWLRGFLKRACAIQDYWKTSLHAGEADPVFPPLPQAA